MVKLLMRFHIRCLLYLSGELKHRTFGVLMMPWGEKIPSQRMFEVAMLAAQVERETIENG